MSTRPEECGRCGMDHPSTEACYAHVLDNLTDPEMVGATEYAAIYEALADAVENAEEDGVDPCELLVEMCDEFIAHATAIKARLRPENPTLTNPISGLEHHRLADGSYETAEEVKARDHDASCTGTFQPPVLDGSNLWICDVCSFAVERRPQ